MASCHKCGRKVRFLKTVCAACQANVEAPAPASRADEAPAPASRADEAADGRPEQRRRQDAADAAAKAAASAARWSAPPPGAPAAHPERHKGRTRLDAENRRLATITSEYDQFSRLRTLAAPESPAVFVGGDYRLEGKITCRAWSIFPSGRSDAQPQGEVTRGLLFVRVARVWTWLESDDATGLADGLPMALRIAPGRNDLSPDGGVIEVRTVYLDATDLDQWFEARSVRLRIGLWDTKIGRDTLENLRAVELKRAILETH